MKNNLLIVLAVLLLGGASLAQQRILINNAEVFNGTDANTQRANVLIEGNRILKISTAPIATDKSANTQIIDAQGKFLMPGL
ncbi:MAG: amidohydrolase family protein, partial [Flavobacteriaceae bacterium]|nr:amidohydrolase family protein [Flavobacteriaceae bacterium]